MLDYLSHSCLNRTTLSILYNHLRMLRCRKLISLSALYMFIILLKFYNNEINYLLLQSQIGPALMENSEDRIFRDAIRFR